MLIFVVILTVILGGIGFVFLSQKKTVSAPVSEPPIEEKKPEKKPEIPVKKPVQKPVKVNHNLLVHTLKGHTNVLTAALFNEKFIVTASKDRSIRLIFRDSNSNSQKKQDKSQEKYHRLNIKYDHVTAFSFSSDGKILACATEGGKIQLYNKLVKKPELVTEFPISHSSDVHSIVLNDIGKWMTIVTCAGEDDTEVKCWSVTGDLLQVLNTNQIKNYHMCASSDNRFIAVAAYTPEVKILEILRNREDGSFKKMQKAMALSGHTSGVLDVAFNGSDTLPVNRMVTTSKDGSVRLWDINVRYTLQEDPKVIKTFNVEQNEAFHTVGFSPDGKVLALTHDKKLIFMVAETMKVITEIDVAHEVPITRVIFDPSGTEVLVKGENCKHAYIYKVPLKKLLKQ